MMRAWKIVCLSLALGILLSAALKADPPSAQDTFMVLDTVAMPGEVLPVTFYVANDSLELGAIAAYFEIDNSLLEWVGEWDSLYNPPTFYIRFDTLERAMVPDLFSPFHSFMNANFHISGVEFAGLNGAGIVNAIPKGRGPLYRIFVKVKEATQPGTQALVAPFDPLLLPPNNDSRTSRYSDISGTDDVQPTLVPGTITVIPLIYGDANRDGIANISDCIFLIGYIFGGGAAPNPLALGDASCDGITNITDAIYLLEYIFTGGPPPGYNCE